MAMQPSELSFNRLLGDRAGLCQNADQIQPALNQIQVRAQNKLVGSAMAGAAAKSLNDLSASDPDYKKAHGLAQVRYLDSETHEMMVGEKPKDGVQLSPQKFMTELERINPKMMLYVQAELDTFSKGLEKLNKSSPATAVMIIENSSPMVREMLLNEVANRKDPSSTEMDPIKAAVAREQKFSNKM